MSHAHTQEVTVENLKGKLSAMKEKKQQEASQIEGLMAKVEEVSPGPKRYLKEERDTSELLQQKVCEYLNNMPTKGAAFRGVPGSHSKHV